MKNFVTADTETLLAELARVVVEREAGGDPAALLAELRPLVHQLSESNRRLYARLDEILQVVTAMTALDFRRKLEPDEEDDWLIHALVIGLNITGDELRRRAEALTETRDRALAANRAKTAFLTNMSHELRTPLNAIIGYSELLREECAGVLPEHQLVDLDRVVSAGRHLLSLIKDTLDLSKIEAGKVELVVEPFAIDPLIDEVVGTMKALADSRENDFIVQRAPGLGQMVSDRMRLAQILYNLLSNAIKFTSLGTIRFDVRRSADEVMFTVEDTGIGIPRDKLDLVFGAFNQADEETTRRYGGTGLGLTITRHFSEMMGGEIHVTSQVGSGSVFTLTLPTELAGMSGVFRRVGEPRRPGARSVIFLVSDDPRLAEALHQIFAPHGVAVVPIVSSQEAPRLAAHLRPAVIILDDQIADLGSLLLAIGADPELTAIPRFIVCELPSYTAATQGGDASLVRPLRHDDVVAAILPHLRPPPDLGTVLVVLAAVDPDRTLRTTLEARGWRVHEASDVDGVRAYVTGGQTVDAVVLDLAVPWIAAVADVLRRNPTTRPRAILGLGTGEEAAAELCTAYVQCPGRDYGRLLATLALEVHALGPSAANAGRGKNRHTSGDQC